MKTKKVLILILLIILAISSTACVDKDSVEYIYNIRRFVGEYENKDHKIYIASIDVLDPYSVNQFYDYISGEVSTNGYNKVSRDGEIIFVEQKIEPEDVEFFNYYLKIINAGGLKITRKKVTFLGTELSLKIKSELPPGPQEVIDLDIYRGHKTILFDEDTDPNIPPIVLGYSKLSQSKNYIPCADVEIRKKYIDKNNRERKISLSLIYELKKYTNLTSN